MKRIIIGVIALYTGIIANACLLRITFSFARHGQITWGDIFYPSKIILILVVIYTYLYLKKATINVDTNLLQFLIKLSRIRLIILVLSSAFAFWQFGFIRTLYLPLKVLFVLW
ncbi:MAG: hypothetical protein WCK52_04560 [Betaproteobacteria bacterium]